MNLKVSTSTSTSCILQIYLKGVTFFRGEKKPFLSPFHTRFLTARLFRKMSITVFAAVKYIIKTSDTVPNRKMLRDIAGYIIKSMGSAVV